VTEPIDPLARDPRSAKTLLRRAALVRRDALCEAARRTAAERIADAIADLPIASGTVVAGYLPIRSEIDPRPAMRRAAAIGAILALPAVLADGVSMEFRRWSFGDPLEEAEFGLRVPPAAAGTVVPDVVLMPLAAFDDAGRRIGWGKGHYDRALMRLERTHRCMAIGLAFTVQRVSGVPDEPHDRRLDLILTEEGPIRPEGVLA
jgi:5-formyltetrahydrofolate cyclo-ligase